MTNVLRDHASQYGHVEGKLHEFVVDGDLKAAYVVLKDMFEPIAHSKSGPIRPLTIEEIRLRENKPVADTLNEI